MSALALRITEAEEAALDQALTALGRVMRLRGHRTELSVFLAFQDIYRARKALTNQPAAGPVIHAVEAASREMKA